MLPVACFVLSVICCYLLYSLRLELLMSLLVFSSVCAACGGLSKLLVACRVLHVAYCVLRVRVACRALCFVSCIVCAFDCLCVFCFLRLFVCILGCVSDRFHCGATLRVIRVEIRLMVYRSSYIILEW